MPPPSATLLDALTHQAPPAEPLLTASYQIHPNGRLTLTGRETPQELLPTIFSALPPWTHELRLLNTGIGPEGALHLAKHLRTNPPLTGVDLWGNQLGPYGAATIAESLPQTTQLKCLGLGRNRVLDEGISRFFDALPPALETLELTDNALSPAGLSAIIARAPSAGITALRVGGPEMDAKFIEPLFALIESDALFALTVSGHRLPESVLVQLVARFQNNLKLLHFDLGGPLPSKSNQQRIAWLCRNRNCAEPARVSKVARAFSLFAAPVVFSKPPRPKASIPTFSEAELSVCIKVLEALKAGRGRDQSSPALKKARALITALARTERRTKRPTVKMRSAAKADDQRLIESTGIRVRRRNSRALPAGVFSDSRALSKSRKCYICKQRYFELDIFYDSLCPDCAALNIIKRNQTIDMRGKVVLVTGGRIKIGFEIIKKLLAAGAEVIATTRFPKDAARRYNTEIKDRASLDRLHLYPLDLRNLPAVERFCEHLQTNWSRLDALINNAAQTVSRPRAFYAALEAYESKPLGELSEGVRALIRHRDAALSIPSTELGTLALFPKDSDDGHGQPLDLRSHNSWRMQLDEVSMPELIEVHLINTMAPFLLNARLKGLMLKTPEPAKFIVNVSAMEGVFDRYFKSHFHPHTNMAKAALNMLTRTSAKALSEEGLYMTSVDTGWVTNENPYPVSEHMAQGGFQPPLDEVDGAARVLDPVFSGLKGDLQFGVFLKDYKPSPW